jgi:hypothetical protein
MNLGRVVEKFSDSEFTDFFGTATFMGNIDPFRDATRSSSNTERRILTTVPSVSIPSRRVISTNNELFIVANAEHDYYRGVVLRSKYTVAPVSKVFTVKTLSQLVNSQTGITDVYGAVESPILSAIKQDTSDAVLKMFLVFSAYENIAVDSIVYASGVVYKTTSDTFIDGVGFGCVELVSLGSSAIKNVTVVSNTGRDLVAETNTSSTYSNVKSLSALSDVSFRFSSADRLPIEPGDVTYWISKTIVTNKPIEGSVVDGRSVVGCKEVVSGVWEVRTRI